MVEYSTADQARAVEELEALPEGAFIVQMLSDYVVLRDQVRACNEERAEHLPGEKHQMPRPKQLPGPD